MVDKHLGKASILKQKLETNVKRAIVEQVGENITDVCYVTRDGIKLTVYEDGTIIEGRIDVWDGISQEVPEFAEFNWYIYNGAQLKFLANFVNNGNTLTTDQETLIANSSYQVDDIKIDETVTIYLMDDIDLGARQSDGVLTRGTAWESIGCWYTCPLMAIFEGNNHTILGLYVVDEDKYAGFIGNTINSVYNLTVKDGYVEGTDWTAGVCCDVSDYSESGQFDGVVANADLINCHNINTKVNGTGYGAGGICSYFDGREIKSCSNTGEIVGDDCVGGITGESRGRVTDCVNRGFISGRVLARRYMWCFGG